MGFWEITFNILVVLFFVFLNGFFVAAEFAIVKVRATQIEPMVRKRNRRARLAKELITHLDAYLSATQLGITMASLALGWVGEPYVAGMLRPLFERLSITSEHVADAVAFGIAFGFITFLHIVIGELAPKNLAIQKSKATALWVAYPLRVFFLIFRPVISLLNLMANVLLKIVGMTSVGESELAHSEEELRILLVQEQGVSSTSKTIALSAMDFRRKQARHFMVPRVDIVGLSLTAPVAESIERMRTNKFSRYPVFNETIDNIIGVVHTKDIFKTEIHHEPEFRLESVLRDAVFLPETVYLEKVLETMLHKKTHIVILADEFGGTAGLISLEDVLEELVGPIQDEFDREKPEVTKLAEDEYLVDASMVTHDIEHLVNRELSSKDVLSVGALISEQLGHIPVKGESIEVNGVRFTVELVEDRAVEIVRVKRLPEPERSEE
jgi:CBS domain containing-hemolysin-like protein